MKKGYTNIQDFLYTDGEFEPDRFERIGQKFTRKEIEEYADFFPQLIRGMAGHEDYCLAGAGTYWPDWLYDKCSDAIRDVVRKRSMLSRQALERWPEKRIEPIKGMLIDSICAAGRRELLELGFNPHVDERHIAMGGNVKRRGISNKLFFEYCPKIRDALLHDRGGQYEAIRDWPSERLEPMMEDSIKQNGHRAEFAVAIGIKCSDESFAKHGGLFLVSIAKKPDFAVEAGTLWPINRFNMHKEQIVSLTAGNEKEALLKWPMERLEEHYEQFFGSIEIEPEFIWGVDKDQEKLEHFLPYIQPVLEERPHYSLLMREFSSAKPSKRLSSVLNPIIEVHEEQLKIYGQLDIVERHWWSEIFDASSFTLYKEFSFADYKAVAVVMSEVPDHERDERLEEICEHLPTVVQENALEPWLECLESEKSEFVGGGNYRGVARW